LHALFIKNLVGNQFFYQNGGASIGFKQLLRMSNNIRCSAASLIVLGLQIKKEKLSQTSGTMKGHALAAKIGWNGTFFPGRKTLMVG
jgi:hypothetical protein